MDILNTYVIPHWPLLTVTLALALIGQVLKGSLFSREMAQKNVVFWWGRKTLPAHPVFVGMIIGFVPGVPVGPGIDTLAARVMYFMAAGVLSTWAFSIVKQLAKKRGLELDMVDAKGKTIPPGGA